MKINEIVYYCLDAIKAFSDDSYVNEDHVIFLIGKYRGSLLQQYQNIKKVIPESNYQTICITLQKNINPICVSGPMLKSVEEIPHLMTVGNPQILLSNGMESEMIHFVSYSRLKSVGYDKWKSNFIYAAIGPDNHLYLSSNNPQASYLSEIKMKGIFEDYDKASELECEENKQCDIMERDFPLEVSLVPNLIAYVVKDVLGVAYRPADNTNDTTDALASIATFIRQNMKDKYLKETEGETE